MAKHRVDELDFDSAEEFFAELPQCRHLRVRRRADLLTIESGDPRDPVPHARLRQVTVHLWRLEMPTHSGRWETTPLRDQLRALLEMLARDFGWALAPIDEAWPEKHP
jgi:hypothetical protein